MVAVDDALNRFHLAHPRRDGARETDNRSKHHSYPTRRYGEIHGAIVIPIHGTSGEIFRGVAIDPDTETLELCRRFLFMPAMSEVKEHVGHGDILKHLSY